MDDQTPNPTTRMDTPEPRRRRRRRATAAAAAAPPPTARRAPADRLGTSRSGRHRAATAVAGGAWSSAS